MDSTTRISENLVWAKGKAVETIGSLSGSKEWQESGAQEASDATARLESARQDAYQQANIDNISGKVESAIGMLTGDKAKLNEGNLKAQEAEVKRAANAEDLSTELPSNLHTAKERLLGKAESAQGMLTGDQKKQEEGNMRDATAEVKDTVNKAIFGT